VHGDTGGIPGSLVEGSSDGFSGESPGTAPPRSHGSTLTLSRNTNPTAETIMAARRNLWGISRRIADTLEHDGKPVRRDLAIAEGLRIAGAMKAGDRP